MPPSVPVALIRLRLEARGVLAHVRLLDVEDPRVLRGAAQYRVGAQLGVDPRVPLVGLGLRGEHRRAAPLPGLQYLEQVDRVERVLDRRREEVVQDEQVRLAKRSGAS